MLRWTIVVTVPMLVCAGCGSLCRALMSASWRDRWQQPEVVMQTLSLKPGDHVADLGAGGGYFTFRLADAVGPTGKVYAVDVDKGNLDYITQRARERGYTHVEPILAEYDDPLLPEGGVDLIFICNTYHHLKDRADYFASAARYLRPGGRVVIVDLNGNDWFSWLFGHWTAPETSRREMEAAGYTLTSEFTFLTRQTFQVFTKNRQSPQA